MKKICFIAQFPPPIHGLSKAVDTLYNSILNTEINDSGKYIFEKVDITNNRFFLKSLRCIKNSNADLFYLTISQSKFGNLRDLIILNTILKRKKKCIIHLHGGGYYRKLVDNEMPSWQKKLNYKLVSKLDGVIVLSNCLKYIFKGMIDEQKIYVVNNCVDDTSFIQDFEFQEKMKNLVDKKIIHILWLSNFIRTKGFHDVLKLAKLEKERVDEGHEQRFCFDFAGAFFDKKEKLFFDNYIKENKLDKIVIFHGICVGEEKLKLLRQCNIFALPTRYHIEGQPISILEAMGSGMYIVTTDHAGIPDIVTSGKNGIVMKINDEIETLYKNLLELKNEDIITIGHNNRDFILKNFKEQNYISNMSKVFGTVLDD